MAFKITVENGIVRAVLSDRRTSEETRAFLAEVARWSEQHTAILLQIRASRAVFQVEQQGLIELLREIARTPAHRVALLADTLDLQVSHDYLEILARQRGLNVRSVRREAEALQWFGETAAAASTRPAERRSGRERRQTGERRQGGDRRRGGEHRRRSA